MVSDFKENTLAMKRSKKSSHIFQLCYPDLCNTFNVPMIFPIKAHLHKKMLEFNADRVKLEEWRPILRALSLDRSLHYIAILSKHLHSQVLDSMDSETKCRAMVKLPVLYSSFIFKKLINSLTNCVSYNIHLKCLELDGLLLSEEYLSTLIMGLQKSASIQHLSLHRCPLGDRGCELICHYLRSSPNIVSIDMSGCNISEKGAYIIAKTLEFQNLNRFSEKWKQSLRYRTPDTEVMPGLRRVILNHNPNIGDSGVEYFIDVLRDDLWLKAFDLQNVGITNKGGEILLSLLRFNACLSVLDVQNNPGLDTNLLHSIMEQLASNNKDRIPEHHWIKENTPFLQRKHSLLDGSVPPLPRNFEMTGVPVFEKYPDCSNKIPAVRLTQSSVLPTRKRTSIHHFPKVHSACVIGTPQFNQHCPRALPVRYRRPHVSRVAAQHSGTECQQLSRSELFHGAGDVVNLEQARAIIQEMSLKIEEESQKRLEAERQKQNVERKHEQFIEDFKKAMSGQVLMDKSVVEEISEAFADFNGFLSVISESGLARQLPLPLSGLRSMDSLLLSNKEITPLSSSCFSTVSEKDMVNDDDTQPNRMSTYLRRETMISRCDSMNSFCSNISLLALDDPPHSPLEKQSESLSSTEKQLGEEGCHYNGSVFASHFQENIPEAPQQKITPSTEVASTISRDENVDKGNIGPTSCTADSSQSWSTVVSLEDC